LIEREHFPQNFLFLTFDEVNIYEAKAIKYCSVNSLFTKSHVNKEDNDSELSDYFT